MAYFDIYIVYLYALKHNYDPNVLRLQQGLGQFYGTDSSI
jgi:hypothetical protein